MTEQPTHHFYGSTAYNWTTAGTRAEVLVKLAKLAGAEVIKQSMTNGNGGLLTYTCRVLVPADAEYGIKNYMPVDVPTDRDQDFRIVSVKGYVVPVEVEYNA